MVYAVMNLKTSIKDESSFDDFDTKSAIIRKGNKLAPVIGGAILMSDGSLMGGSNPDLVSREGCFNISEGDSQRFYWGDGSNFYNSEPYFFRNGLVPVLGHQLADRKTLEIVDEQSKFSLYNPMLTISALYKKNKVKDIVLKDGAWNFLMQKYKYNTEGKIKFLEAFLKKKDKSGFKPKDMIVNNNNLRLKLLENNYRNNVETYSSKF